jgi:ABC-type amino acid transport substrate-binding protein
MSFRKTLLLSMFCAAMVVALFATTAAAGKYDLVVIYPGGVSASDEARTQVGQLLTQLAKMAGWPAGVGTAQYFNKEDEGLQYIQSKKPGFILTTPGFYLKHRAKLGLTPVNKISMNNSTSANYYVIAKKSTLTSLADLAGKTLAGSSLAEADFISRVILENKLVFGKDVTAKPMGGLAALRALRAGTVNAVVLDAKEYKSLPGLPYANEFVTIFTSKPIPTTGIMAIGANTGQAEIKALAAASKNFCATPEGKNVCTTFEITGFEPATANDYASLVALWGK